MASGPWGPRPRSSHPIWLGIITPAKVSESHLVIPGTRLGMASEAL